MFYIEYIVQNIVFIFKMLIGIVLFKVQEMGKLKLDDFINDYLFYIVVNFYFLEIFIIIWYLIMYIFFIVDIDIYDEEFYIISF